MRMDVRGPSSSLLALCAALVMAGALGGCAVGPNYKTPAMAVPAAFKEAPPGWKVAQPADHDPRGAWWEVFGDPTLNALIEKANQANQSIAEYEAAYRQATALVAQARSSYFPTISLNGSETRSGYGSVASGTGQPSVSTSYSAKLDASWEPDLWGSVRRKVASERASAQNAQANLANARLSVQGTLAEDYFQLRALDSAQTLYDDTVRSYQDYLKLTQNRYAQGVAGRSDVLQAQTQLQNAQASAVDNQVDRAQYEHAIAVLVGEPASVFSLAAAPLQSVPPTIPLALPSTLLERRPDVAAAERSAAAANEQIGIYQAAFFPTLTLSATGGFASSMFSNWLTAPARMWTIGPQLAATLFDGGLRRAEVAGARAAYDQAAATYRATVLSAFQDVEDNLSSLRILANEAAIDQQAVVSAQQSLTVTTNGYKAGTNQYLDVLTAQATLLSTQRSLIDVNGRRMVAAAGLIKALGGGWEGLSAPVDQNGEPVVAAAGPVQNSAGKSPVH
ncbi:RND transporter [Robbsia andropogonis]|uniref:RND transporter n=1 Tax=Robbsia andropogonis TaxID=28092 RepID=A0A0F5K2Y2_9BURK|nr:efflux transporter outer membrane subunit [Robbsia andropogonis]KKB64453.1 RND transporter [Robbsia andropogonis]MCP1119006.1 efflux transporter outer membrane subunit [Robbsia andropogonis]MCP1128642.1 efflux transporter outer membrane subunit [Robbsia andropogonis]